MYYSRQHNQLSYDGLLLSLTLLKNINLMIVWCILLHLRTQARTRAVTSMGTMKVGIIMCIQVDVICTEFLSWSIFILASFFCHLKMKFFIISSSYAKHKHWYVLSCSPLIKQKRYQIIFWSKFAFNYAKYKKKTYTRRQIKQITW